MIHKAPSEAQLASVYFDNLRSGGHISDEARADIGYASNPEEVAQQIEGAQKVALLAESVGSLALSPADQIRAAHPGLATSENTPKAPRQGITGAYIQNRKQILG